MAKLVVYEVRAMDVDSAADADTQERVEYATDRAPAIFRTLGKARTWCHEAIQEDFEALFEDEEKRANMKPADWTELADIHGQVYEWKHYSEDTGCLYRIHKIQVD